MEDPIPSLFLTVATDTAERENIEKHPNLPVRVKQREAGEGAGGGRREEGLAGMREREEECGVAGGREGGKTG